LATVSTRLLGEPINEFTLVRSPEELSLTDPNCSDKPQRRQLSRF